jgi:hypothetical protein
MTTEAKGCPQRCETCRFWDPSDEPFHKKEIGDCRRNPPLINDTLLRLHLRPPTIGGAMHEQEELETDIYTASAFPMTHAASWCGRFEWQREAEPMIV